MVREQTVLHITAYIEGQTLAQIRCTKDNIRVLPKWEERVAAEGHVLQRAQKLVLFLLAQGLHSASVSTGTLKAVLPERELVGSDVTFNVAHLVDNTSGNWSGVYTATDR